MVRGVEGNDEHSLRLRHALDAQFDVEPKLPEVEPVLVGWRLIGPLVTPMNRIFRERRECFLDLLVRVNTTDG